MKWKNKMTYIDDNKYWMNYYDKNKIPNEESSFAKNNINTVGVDFKI